MNGVGNFFFIVGRVLFDLLVALVLLVALPAGAGAPTGAAAGAGAGGAGAVAFVELVSLAGCSTSTGALRTIYYVTF